jgi:hypothetical protein
MSNSASPGPYRRPKVLLVKPRLAISLQFVFGALLLILGITVFLTGFNASHTTPGLADNAAFARFRTWYVLGGILTGFVGLSLLLVGLFKSRA